MIPDITRDAYPAWFGKFFQSRRDVDAVAVNLLIPDDNIAGIYADAELDPTVGRDACIALSQFALDIEAASYRVHGALELDEKAVAGGADQPAAVPDDFGFDQIFYIPGKAEVCALFIDPHQPGIADDIGDQDGCQPAPQVSTVHADHLSSRHYA